MLLCVETVAYRALAAAILVDANDHPAQRPDVATARRAQWLPLLAPRVQMTSSKVDIKTVALAVGGAVLGVAATYLLGLRRKLAAPKGIKLTYFEGRGLGEVPRLLLAQAGVKVSDTCSFSSFEPTFALFEPVCCAYKYEDVRLSDEKWKELKPSTQWGQIPQLEVEGKGKLAQSRAIQLYLAQQFDLNGADEWEAAQIWCVRCALLLVPRAGSGTALTALRCWLGNAQERVRGHARRAQGLRPGSPRQGREGEGHQDRRLLQGHLVRAVLLRVLSPSKIFAHALVLGSGPRGVRS